MDFFTKNERVRSFSIYEHDTTLKIAFGATYFLPILIPDPLPLGKYSPHIAPVDAMVIDFLAKKSSCGVVKSVSEASVHSSK